MRDDPKVPGPDRDEEELASLNAERLDIDELDNGSLDLAAGGADTSTDVCTSYVLDTNSIC